MNIKKLFSSFAAAILVFAACEETNPDLGDPSVTLSKTQLEFAKEGGSQEITLNSTRDWSVLNRPEWVSITPEKGAASAKDQTIVISVMDNADAPRNCVITFIGTTARADLAIVQDGDGVAPGTDPKTIFSVDFTAGQGDFSIDTRKAPEGLAVWTQSSSYGMVASGYVKADSKDYDTESWLVSPVIDLSSEKAAFLSFEHACNFFTDIETAKKEVGVKVKVEGGEWESLSGFAYPETLSWSFVNSGSVDLASYLGKKVQIAFVYTSTAAKAGTWEIKNVSVKSEPGGADTPDVPEGAITWLMGTNNGQSWSSVTDASYGDGYEYTKDGITLGYYKNKSSSNPVDAKTDHIRVYKFYALKIKSTKPLKSIIFYTTESAYAFDLTDAEGKMTAAADAASKTISWTGNASELLFFANNGQVRINKIVFVCE